MFHDIRVIAWKELKEYLAGQGFKGGGILNLLVLAGVFGIFLPAQFGRSFLQSPINLLLWSWVPAFLVISAVADSFAGERERHTLETLLASRVSDRAIVLGKVAGVVAYGWGLTVVCLGLGVLSYNIMYRQGSVVLPAPDLALAILVISLLVAVLTASLGAVLSMKAASMRQVFQAMSVTWMLTILGFSFGSKAVLSRLPKESAGAIVKGVQMLAAPAHRGKLIIGLILVLGGAGLILFAIAEKRFRRLRCAPR